MTSSTILREGQSIVIDETRSKQISSMMEVMDGNVFSLTPSPRGMILSAEGNIGQVMFRDGTSLDIVPSMDSVKSDDGSSLMMMEMLYSVFGISTRDGVADNLFEFTIKVFIDTVSRLVVKGLRSKYHQVSGNEKSFKGRIVFNEHIRQNYIHKERIFVEYEYYSQNRPENRLIKATLEALSRRSADSRNMKGLKALILAMEDIPASSDVDRDLSMITIDRNMVDYVSPMLWCNIFLKGMGLAGASKENLSYSMLVRTDDLYSAYVAKMSTIDRTDGSYQMRYSADVAGDGDSNGVSVVNIDISWSFYDRARGTVLRDAELLFMSAPGHRVIPEPGDNRLKSMADSHLSDVLA